ncbi:hypothetical protein C1H46_015098 [Malus baccata]|uniref:TFIIS central domain-containing protein n=1 Tax=Malus baccata TaxID=106549 RepID=A0A540MLP7_MALBA|nr:hypothetical protein C1H46_015098 [Malus baccata]
MHLLKPDGTTHQVLSRTAVTHILYSTNKSGFEGRDHIRDCIARSLSLLSEEDYERYKVSFKASDPSKVAAQVEAALFQFEHSRPVDKPSEVKRPVLLETLRRNKDLRRQVLFGEITPEMLLNMPIAELRQKYPANSRQILLPPSRERRVIRLCIAGGLSKVSEEVDERYMDSVNASDPSKVAAQVEAALFKHWGPDETMEPVAYRFAQTSSSWGDHARDVGQHVPSRNATVEHVAGGRPCYLDIKQRLIKPLELRLCVLVGSLFLELPLCASFVVVFLTLGQTNVSSSEYFVVPSPEYQQLVVDARALPAPDAVIRRACDTIAVIARENVSTKNLVRIEGGIPPLVELLSFCDTKVQIAAAGALRTLAFKNDENKNQLI